MVNCPPLITNLMYLISWFRLSSFIYAHFSRNGCSALFHEIFLLGSFYSDSLPMTIIVLMLFIYIPGCQFHRRMGFTANSFEFYHKQHECSTSNVPMQRPCHYQGSGKCTKKQKKKYTYIIVQMYVHRTG